MAWEDVRGSFNRLAREEGRAGVVAAVEFRQVRLLPQQERYLEERLASLLMGASPDGGPEPGLTVPSSITIITAVSLGLAYDRAELHGIPVDWASKPDRAAWNEYARAYGRLNEAVTRVAARLAGEFGGVAEGATLEGRAGQVKHVSEYYPHCVSHRTVAAVAGLGWIGKHGLLVTPEYGPAVRLATVFLPGRVERLPLPREAGCDREGDWGCNSCRACLDACPILERATEQEDRDLYRDGCLRRIRSLALEADVCGICVRACVERPRP